MDTRKLLVISDIHGNINKLKQVFSWAQDSKLYDTAIRDVVFLGDGINDLYKAANAAGYYCNLNKVRGNNDYGAEIPETAIFNIEKHHFFICHGHRYALYSGYHTLINAARYAGAGTVLFGHTHIPYMNSINGITLINPGSIGNPRSRIGASFAVIECMAGEPLKTNFFGIGAEIREITLPGN
ncbi:MAG: YfcE family phosphodiesterase [Treponema sp.]|jgi:putative phosphoesterase|nr:YfcE family phosphodiesterase [Treponema sp.]